MGKIKSSSWECYICGINVTPKWKYQAEARYVRLALKREVWAGEIWESWKHKCFVKSWEWININPRKRALIEEGSLC